MSTDDCDTTSHRYSYTEKPQERSQYQQKGVGPKQSRPAGMLITPPHMAQRLHRGHGRSKQTLKDASMSVLNSQRQKLASCRFCAVSNCFGTMSSIFCTRQCIRALRNGDNLHQIRLTSALFALPMHRYNTITSLHHSIGFGLVQSLLNHRVCAHE